jgi:hypothetical protein
MTTAVLALWGVLVAGDAAQAVAPARAGSDVRASLSPKARAAFDRLMRTKTFESATVGEGGKRSDNAAAVRTLIRQREAPAAFQTLYDSGSPIAALYALTAFWYLRPAEFLTHVRQVRDRYGEKEIDTRDGCVGGRQRVDDLLESKKDNVRFAPGAGLYDFMCGPRTRNTTYADFVSGIVPITIVEGNIVEDRRCAHPPPRPDYLKPRR